MNFGVARRAQRWGEAKNGGLLTAPSKRTILPLGNHLSGEKTRTCYGCPRKTLPSPWGGGATVPLRPRSSRELRRKEAGPTRRDRLGTSSLPWAQFPGVTFLVSGCAGKKNNPKSEVGWHPQDDPRSRKGSASLLQRIAPIFHNWGTKEPLQKKTAATTRTGETNQNNYLDLWQKDCDPVFSNKKTKRVGGSWGIQLT